jgi:competence ComEA-like helix-hairpin-helix protein
MTGRINRTEQIIVLVLTCLILMGSGFRLWVRPDDLVVEVDPVLWAEEFGENRQQGEGHQGEVEGSIDSRRERPAEAVLGGGGDPSPGQQSQGQVLEGAADLDKQQLNINTASKEALQLLPGIGPVLAERIIEYRRVYGPFIDVEQLIEVKGIGPRILERLRPLVTVTEGPAGGGK